jgi:hypothetical protein
LAHCLVGDSAFPPHYCSVYTPWGEHTLLPLSPAPAHAWAGEAVVPGQCPYLPPALPACLLYTAFVPPPMLICVDLKNWAFVEGGVVMVTWGRDLGKVTQVRPGRAHYHLWYSVFCIQYSVVGEGRLTCGKALGGRRRRGREERYTHTAHTHTPTQDTPAPHLTTHTATSAHLSLQRGRPCRGDWLLVCNAYWACRAGCSRSTLLILPRHVGDAP